MEFDHFRERTHWLSERADTVQQDLSAIKDDEKDEKASLDVLSAQSMRCRERAVELRKEADRIAAAAKQRGGSAAKLVKDHVQIDQPHPDSTSESAILKAKKTKGIVDKGDKGSPARPTNTGHSRTETRLLSPTKGSRQPHSHSPGRRTQGAGTGKNDKSTDATSASTNISTSIIDLIDLDPEATAVVTAASERVMDLEQEYNSLRAKIDSLRSTVMTCGSNTKSTHSKTEMEVSHS